MFFNVLLCEHSPHGHTLLKRIARKKIFKSWSTGFGIEANNKGKKATVQYCEQLPWKNCNAIVQLWIQLYPDKISHGAL